METIEYTVKFFSEWHCGSGLAAGANINALVVKDKNELPFIPGKTIKGLVREAVEDILSFKNEKKEKIFYETFGYNNDDEENKKNIDDIEKLENNGVGCCFFSNAVLNETLSSDIKNEDLVRFLYRSHSSTAIEDSGIAKEHSLREIETVIPCELHGTINYVPKLMEENIKDGLGLIKRLGVNRNRGLGRCQITLK
ncbi:MAG: RAMP superfamily CRISPR-associated protein [Candidatus Symbiothrix sp.]|jgi:CRISPR/Cas system CSM-associated protein Csm3 (group 7 of RAMP superfamily)|nr:RAMP superfamily CRISPR-associated protein [Candidatus Symbiothrix sp.]